MNWFLKLLEKWSCKHKWKVVMDARVKRTSEFGHKEFTRITYCCTECGKFKAVESS